jgi:hypothetical protein
MTVWQPSPGRGQSAATPISGRTDQSRHWMQSAAPGTPPCPQADGEASAGRGSALTGATGGKQVRHPRRAAARQGAA